MRMSMAKTLLVLALAFIPASAAKAQQLQTFTSRHYEVVTNLDRREAASVARHMDAVYREYERRFEGFRLQSSVKPKLYLMGTEQEYLTLLSSFGFDGAGTGGIFFISSRGGSGLATWVHGKAQTRLRHVLQHEGFHQFAFKRLGANVPLWVNEGLAEYFGQSLLVGGRLKLGLTPESRLLSLVKAIKADDYIPFEELITMTPKEWNRRVRTDPKGADLQYSESWSLSQFLIHAGSGKYRSAFVRYLNLIAAGRDLRGAFVEAFRSTDLAPFERAWKAYILELEPDPLSSGVERLEFLAEGCKALLENGLEIESLEDLKAKLREGRFALVRVEHGIVREVRSDEDRLFEAPPGPNPRKPSVLTLTPPAKPGFGPEMRITGLRIPMRLSWRRGGDGELAYEISFGN